MRAIETNMKPARHFLRYPGGYVQYLLCMLTHLGTIHSHAFVIDDVTDVRYVRERMPGTRNTLGLSLSYALSCPSLLRIDRRKYC